MANLPSPMQCHEKQVSMDGVYQEGPIAGSQVIAPVWAALSTMSIYMHPELLHLHTEQRRDSVKCQLIKIIPL